MARTNPCQICGEVPAAEFTLSAAAPELSWFAFPDGSPMLVANICEGCLINAAYQRTLQLADAEAHEGALEHIEQSEQLEPVGGPEGLDERPKSGPPETEDLLEEIPEAAPAAPG